MRRPPPKKRSKEIIKCLTQREVVVKDNTKFLRLLPFPKEKGGRKAAGFFFRNSVESEEGEHAEGQQPGVGQEGPLLLDGDVLCLETHDDEARGDPRAPQDAEERQDGKHR